MRMMRASNGSLWAMRVRRPQSSRNIESASDSGTPTAAAYSVVMPCTAVTSSGMIQPSGRTTTSRLATVSRVSRSTSAAANCTIWGWLGCSDGSLNRGRPVVSVS
ncbi:hypothetical protein D3C87_1811990 [compost metagenome]